MKIIAALLIILIVVATRKGDGSVPRRYLGLALVSMGALVWASTFDAIKFGKDVVGDPVLYRRVIL